MFRAAEYNIKSNHASAIRQPTCVIMGTSFLIFGLLSLHLYIEKGSFLPVLKFGFYVVNCGHQYPFFKSMCLKINKKCYCLKIWTKLLFIFLHLRAFYCSHMINKECYFMTMCFKDLPQFVCNDISCTQRFNYFLACQGLWEILIKSLAVDNIQKFGSYK